MSLIPGKYKHYKNEDPDIFYQAVGLPYLARKMINMLSPVLEITLDGDTMRLKQSTWIVSTDNTFKLGEEYIEDLQGDILKCVTSVINDHEMVTNSVHQSSGYKTQRHLVFSVKEVVETLTHEKAEGCSKRYYKRVKE
ncbi:hypothetical protein O0L34_g8810 [Tuta absoluta]|nr:hypothetical protein O0L34_g8810 [Tuta absoluta]